MSASLGSWVTIIKEEPSSFTYLNNIFEINVEFSVSKLPVGSSAKINSGFIAIIIGMVASKFPPEQRKKVIFWGIGGAVILRIILTLLTAYLLQITGLRLIGGLLLLYIVYKLYVDVIKGSEKEEDIKVDNSSFLKAIWTVLLADFTMSLDNVLGVAGAAGEHYGLLVFGLILSIILMATAATLISGWIKKYRWIAWIGLLAILVVAVELIYTDIKILFL